jgi:hypothetical protein
MMVVVQEPVKAHPSFIHSKCHKQIGQHPTLKSIISGFTGGQLLPSNRTLLFAVTKNIIASHRPVGRNIVSPEVMSYISSF